MKNICDIYRSFARFREREVPYAQFSQPEVRERIMCLKINSVIARRAMRAACAASGIVLITVKGLINFLLKFN